MNITAQQESYPAKELNANDKKQLSLAAIRKDNSVTKIAKDTGVSRKFVYKQKAKALDAINDSFSPTDEEKNGDKILFYLPVTFTWLCQFILCLVLHCRANHRGIQRLLADVLDHDVSLGSIHNIVADAKQQAKTINDAQDLSHIKLAAQDETFHHNKPVLTGVDIPSLYCYLLSHEEQRDFDAWGTHLLDLKQQGFNPERVFGYDADAIQSAHDYVFPKTPYDIDNFHIIQTMMDMRRYFRNCLKSTISKREAFQEKVQKRIVKRNNENYRQELEVAITEEKEMKSLSQSIDTLVNWMQHDVLNMPGIEPQSRYELFDFVLDELKQLAKQHPHRIQSVCITLTNQKYQLLAFTQVLNDKFQVIADDLVFPVEKIREMCELQRCKIGSIRDAVR